MSLPQRTTTALPMTVAVVAGASLPVEASVDLTLSPALVQIGFFAGEVQVPDSNFLAEQEAAIELG